MHRTQEPYGARLVAFHRDRGIGNNRGERAPFRVVSTTRPTPPRRSWVRLIAYVVLGVIALVAYEAAISACFSESAQRQSIEVTR